MAFTEFYCQSGGSNLNAGSTNTDAATLTYASGTWVQGTGVFTVASGDPAADGVAVGDFASVYPDAATVTPFVGRVTARDATTITVSLTAKSGTAPADGTTDTTLKIGGAWKGPNGAVSFPFNGMANGGLVNTSGDFPRFNFKNDATYAITAAMVHNPAVNKTCFYQGYTATPGDGGKAIVDGGTSGASYILLTLGNSSAGHWIIDFVFQNNGESGSADGVSFCSNAIRVVVHDVRGNGLLWIAGTEFLAECEAYNCNQSNAAGKGGFSTASSTNNLIKRCIAHDNTGSNTCGFAFTGNVRMMENCIAESNGSHGLLMGGGSNHNNIVGCEFHNNGGDGLRIASLKTWVENCNFIGNSGYGLNYTGTNPAGFIYNNGFGAGTEANTSGATNIPALNAITVSGSITYAADTTPWVDPANGDFRISLAAAINAGRGTFTQTASGYAGTVGYPDVGAAQHLEAADTDRAAMLVNGGLVQ